MDIMMTVEGRRQIAAGKFIPMYASFTDGSVFYAKDAASGSADASEYVYFEAGSRQQDQIVVETDDSGLLVQYDGGDLTISTDGKIYSSSISTLTSPSGVGTYNRTDYAIVSSSFASAFEKISGSILQSLEQQLLITTEYPFETSKTFKVSNNNAVFNYNNLAPFRSGEPIVEDSSLDPLFVNTRLSHFDNFQFLPPVYTDKSGQQLTVGQFNPLKPTGSLSYEQLMSYLKGPDEQIPLKEKVEIVFTETSIENNLFMQLFEGKTNEETAALFLKKLDCIDFGEFKVLSDKDNPFRRVFFAGKVYINGYGSPSFVNLFTIVAE